MTSWITICDTCKREGWTPQTQPLTDGEIFAGLIEDRAAGRRGKNPACLLHDGLRAGLQCGGASS